MYNSIRGIRPGATALALLVVAGCDIPTELPQWDTRWVVPSEEARVQVATLLPSGTSVTQDGLAFSISVNPSTAAQGLAQLCADCVPLNGLVAPKPAFQGSFQASANLPGDVVVAALAQGSVSIQATHNLTFDPLRPGLGNFGSMTLTVVETGGGRTLGQAVINGANQAFAAGSTLNQTITLAPGAIGGAIRLDVGVTSPAGDPVLMDTSRSISATATATGIRAASATVRTAGRAVSMDAVALDVQDIDGGLIDRIEQGGFQLTVSNPFGVGLNMELRIQGPGFQPVVKNLQISPAANSTIDLALTGEELRRFLGRGGVQIVGSGTVAGGANATVLPSQVLVLGTRLDVTIRIGG